MQMYAFGLTDKEASAALRISEKTVQYHLINVRSKMKLHSRIDLVKLAIGFSLVSLCNVFCVLGQQNPSVTLALDYPTNYWSQISQIVQQVTNPAAIPALTNITLRFYGATNLSGANTPWLLLTTTNNPQAVTNGAEAYYAVAAPILGSPTFYTASFSNVTGQSFFSNLAATPPLPIIQGNLFIRLTP